MFRRPLLAWPVVVVAAAAVVAVGWRLLAPWTERSLVDDGPGPGWLVAGGLLVAFAFVAWTMRTPREGRSRRR